MLGHWIHWACALVVLVALVTVDAKMPGRLSQGDEALVSSLKHSRQVLEEGLDALNLLDQVPHSTAPHLLEAEPMSRAFSSPFQLTQSGTTNPCLTASQYQPSKVSELKCAGISGFKCRPDLKMLRSCIPRATSSSCSFIPSSASVSTATLRSCCTGAGGTPQGAKTCSTLVNEAFGASFSFTAATCAATNQKQSTRTNAHVAASIAGGMNRCCADYRHACLGASTGGTAPPPPPPPPPTSTDGTTEPTSTPGTGAGTPPPPPPPTDTAQPNICKISTRWRPTFVATVQCSIAQTSCARSGSFDLCQYKWNPVLNTCSVISAGRDARSCCMNKKGTYKSAVTCDRLRKTLIPSTITLASAADCEVQLAGSIKLSTVVSTLARQGCCADRMPFCSASAATPAPTASSTPKPTPAPGQTPPPPPPPPPPTSGDGSPTDPCDNSADKAALVECGKIVASSSAHTTCRTSTLTDNGEWNPKMPCTCASAVVTCLRTKISATCLAAPNSLFSRKYCLPRLEGGCSGACRLLNSASSSSPTPTATPVPGTECPSDAKSRLLQCAQAVAKTSTCATVLAPFTGATVTNTAVSGGSTTTTADCKCVFAVLSCARSRLPATCHSSKTFNTQICRPLFAQYQQTSKCATTCDTLLPATGTPAPTSAPGGEPAPSASATPGDTPGSGPGTPPAGPTIKPDASTCPYNMGSLINTCIRRVTAEHSECEGAITVFGVNRRAPCTCLEKVIACEKEVIPQSCYSTSFFINSCRVALGKTQCLSKCQLFGTSETISIKPVGGSGSNTGDKDGTTGSDGTTSTGGADENNVCPADTEAKMASCIKRVVLTTPACVKTSLDAITGELLETIPCDCVDRILKCQVQAVGRACLSRDSAVRGCSKSLAHTKCAASCDTIFSASASSDGDSSDSSSASSDSGTLTDPISPACIAAVKEYTEQSAATCNAALDISPSSTVDNANRQSVLCGETGCIRKLQSVFTICQRSLDTIDPSKSLRKAAIVVNAFRELCPKSVMSPSCFNALSGYEAKVKALDFDGNSPVTQDAIKELCEDPCTRQVQRFWRKSVESGDNDKAISEARAHAAGRNIVCTKNRKGYYCFGDLKDLRRRHVFNPYRICPRVCLRKAFLKWSHTFGSKSLRFDYRFFFRFLCARRPAIAYCARIVGNILDGKDESADADTGSTDPPTTTSTLAPTPVGTPVATATATATAVPSLPAETPAPSVTIDPTPGSTPTPTPTPTPDTTPAPTPVSGCTPEEREMIGPCIDEAENEPSCKDLYIEEDGEEMVNPDMSCGCANKILKCYKEKLSESCLAETFSAQGCKSYFISCKAACDEDNGNGNGNGNGNSATSLSPGQLRTAQFTTAPSVTPAPTLAPSPTSDPASRPCAGLLADTPTCSPECKALMQKRIARLGCCAPITWRTLRRLSPGSPFERLRYFSRLLTTANSVCELGSDLKNKALECRKRGRIRGKLLIAKLRKLAVDSNKSVFYKDVKDDLGRSCGVDRADITITQHSDAKASTMRLLQTAGATSDSSEDGVIFNYEIATEDSASANEIKDELVAEIVTGDIDLSETSSQIVVADPAAAAAQSVSIESTVDDSGTDNSAGATAADTAASNDQIAVVVSDGGGTGADTGAEGGSEGPSTLMYVAIIGGCCVLIAAIVGVVVIVKGKRGNETKSPSATRTGQPQAADATSTTDAAPGSQTRQRQWWEGGKGAIQRPTPVALATDAGRHRAASNASNASSSLPPPMVEDTEPGMGAVDLVDSGDERSPSPSSRGSRRSGSRSGTPNHSNRV